MTPKQRWQAVLEGRRPDRPPCDYWATPEVTRRLLRDLRCPAERDLWQTLGVDKCIFLAPRHPRATEDTWHMPSLFSLWSIPTTRMPYMDGLGEYEEAINPPLARLGSPEALNDFPWPRPDDWDVSHMREQCLEWPGYPIVGASYEPFYLYSRLRGLDQALEDLVENPRLVDLIMERIHDVHSAVIRRVLETAADLIDFIYVAEDLGTQHSLLMSPRAFRRSIKPWLARMIALTHSYGVRVFHHDDGAIRPLIPDLIEIGIDLLNPIQWRCRGMERESLAAEFGRQLVFHGAVDNQRTLPFGSPDDVRREVRDNLAIFKDTRGYIVAPCHNIQANTPTANILALYQAVQN